MEKTYQITESELQALLYEQRKECAKIAEYYETWQLLNAPLPDLSNLKEVTTNPFEGTKPLAGKEAEILNKTFSRLGKQSISKEVTTEKENDLVTNVRQDSNVPCDAPFKDSATIEQWLRELAADFMWECGSEIKKEAYTFQTVIRAFDSWFDENEYHKKRKSLLLNVEQGVQECDASKAKQTDEPLANNTTEEVTECYVPVSVDEELPTEEGDYFVITRRSLFKKAYYHSGTAVSNKRWRVGVKTWLKKISRTH